MSLTKGLNDFHRAVLSSPKLSCVLVSIHAPPTRTLSKRRTSKEKVLQNLLVSDKVKEIESCLESRSDMARMVRARCESRDKDVSWMSMSKGLNSNLYMETNNFPEPEISISTEKKIW
uniref:Uncharacterized protein n=1 Tax=Guillardia theta TaxID=55529 RepID=A0A7S4P5N1_GUITH|mmetsp:Transcript_43593/g.137913  ORF Transcript_43593/g.137913 Transcript_43593/m.137913 type:complete len:118 (+) Transcript_43593:180-533(+)